MDNVTTVGINLAKNVSSVHGVNAAGVGDAHENGRQFAAWLGLVPR